MSYKFSKAFLILQMKTHVPMTDIRQFTCNPFEEHAYLVSDGSGAAVLFDPGFLGGEETSALDALLQKEGLRLQAVLLTHAHFDHIYGVKHCIGRYGTPVYLHPGEAPVLQGDAAFAAHSGMPAPDTDWAWIPVRDGEVLRFAPHLPPRWAQLCFALTYRGSVIRVCMERGATRFRLEKGAPVPLLLYGEERTLGPDGLVVAEK